MDKQKLNSNLEVIPLEQAVNAHSTINDSFDENTKSSPISFSKKKQSITISD
jgi:hypothetical protein